MSGEEFLFCPPNTPSPHFGPVGCSRVAGCVVGCVVGCEMPHVSGMANASRFRHGKCHYHLSSSSSSSSFALADDICGHDVSRLDISPCPLRSKDALQAPRR